ncbi:PREDICTED: uncharacterized protein C1683.06c-like [Branchiostoma belcheri]|uniref:Uncharacterized protein C1683.06c-like n=1 Tax=Branchiostoma belcheri TaxID=7741 RepID=A0A6P5A4D0_BRABE|nr:PREDICTED: uncharacterized protein C1683.06c-like [Branchiostoma belcheri]
MTIVDPGSVGSNITTLSKSVNSNRRTNMSSGENSRQLVVLDVDGGVDDAQAMMLALTHPHVQVLGITCVAGNVKVNQVCQNVLRVLKVFGRPEVPVFAGASVSLLGTHVDACHYLGQDGMGDVPDPDPPSADLVQSEHAVSALLRLSKEYPDEINLVATGPLTNLALAVRTDPGFPARLRKLTLMGGNIHGLGNVTPSAEYNFWCDPEAAHVVLEGYRSLFPITVVPWETCVQDHDISWDTWMDICAIPTKRGQFHAAIQQQMIAKQKQHRLFSAHFHTYDLYAVAVALFPEVLYKTLEVYARVELKGEITRGQMVCDYNDKWGKHPNVRVVKKLDLPSVLNMLRRALE